MFGYADSPAGLLVDCQTLLSQNSIDGDIYFTSWQARQGNKLQLAMEVLATANTTNDIDSFTVQVQTKSATVSDKDAVNLLGTAQTITLTAGAVTTFFAGASADSASEGVRELFRLKLVVKAKTSGRAWVTFRSPSVTWLAN